MPRTVRGTVSVQAGTASTATHHGSAASPCHFLPQRAAVLTVRSCVTAPPHSLLGWRVSQFTAFNGKNEGSHLSVVTVSSGITELLQLELLPLPQAW